MIDAMTYNSSVALVESPAPVMQIGTDDALVAAALAGDEAAFAELFARHKRMVAGIGGRFFPRREQIEEVIQMSFYQAYLALRQYQGGQEHSFAAWLKRITVNTCLDELRKLQRRPENLVSDLSENEAESLFEAMWDRPSAERHTISRDLAQKLLARLEPEDRLTLTLLYEDEWSVAEISELLGWSISKVKGRAHKARKNLQRAMKRFR
jgi:RNA polymerase sigma-70 factor (ECF subfamily)